MQRSDRDLTLTGPEISIYISGRIAPFMIHQGEALAHGAIMRMYVNLKADHGGHYG
jgi:hypothetical protein